MDSLLSRFIRSKTCGKVLVPLYVCIQRYPLNHSRLTGGQTHLIDWH